VNDLAQHPIPQEFAAGAFRAKEKWPKPDSGFVSIMPHIVGHFIHAVIRHFRCCEKIRQWLG